MSKIEQEDIELVKFALDRFTKKYSLSVKDVLSLFSSDDKIPVSIFCEKLSPLETVVKYLRDDKSKTFPEIAKILGKGIPACWTAYKNASKKHKEKFSILPSEYDIPYANIFSKKLSLLELISQYLHTSHKLRFSKIGEILHRDQRTIWTSYSRAVSKIKNENKKTSKPKK